MNTRTILLVEDNPDDVKLTRHAFARSHLEHCVVVAASGDEALDYLWGTGKHAGRNTANQPVVVLLDLKLPQMNGLEVLRRLRADPRTRYQPVVVLTGSKEEQDIASAYELGANSYIRKPVDFDRFSEAVLNLGVYWLLHNEPPPGAAPPP